MTVTNKPGEDDPVVSDHDNCPNVSAPSNETPLSDLEERKLRLEERRFEEEIKTNKLKYDLEERALKKTDPLVLAVVGGLLAAFASIGASYFNGQNQIAAEMTQHGLDMTTEAYRAEASRILETVKLGDADRTACTLKFLMKGGLIQTQSLKDFIDAYLRSRNGGAGVGDTSGQAVGTGQTTSPSQQKAIESATTPGCQPLPTGTSPPKPAENTNTGVTPPSSLPAQTVTYSTGWMSGGHNQNEACDAGIRQFQPQFPNKILSRVSSDEESRKDWLGHVEYRYYCTIAIK